MSEVLKPPKIKKNGNAVFKESCSVADVIRYAVACSDIETVKYIVDEMALSPVSSGG